MPPALSYKLLLLFAFYLCTEGLAASVSLYSTCPQWPGWYHPLLWCLKMSLTCQPPINPFLSPLSDLVFKTSSEFFLVLPSQCFYSTCNLWFHSVFNVAIISANIPDQSKNQQEGYVWSPPSPFVCVSVSLKTKVRTEGDSQDKQKKKGSRWLCGVFPVVGNKLCRVWLLPFHLLVVIIAQIPFKGS